MIIYQVLPRLWGNGRLSAFDAKTFAYLKDLGVTHVWYTGLLRHATGKDFVKGSAGSPYAVSDYYDVNPYLADNPEARMEEFDALVARTHRAGLKFLMDFVPNHVARDYQSHEPGVRSLGADDDVAFHWSPENDFYYYPGVPLQLPVPCRGDCFYEYPAKASGNCFTPSPGENDWYETVKLNYCSFHTGTWDKMYEIVRFWVRKGVDAFRCDMVELVPPEFLKWLIAKIKEEFPKVIFIAEVYQKEKYRKYIDEVCFDCLYDKSGLYDVLRAVTAGHGSAKAITWNWQFLQDLQPRMLNFLENHDEQRIASPWFAGRADYYAALCASLMLNTAPFMLYFGQETGVDASEGHEGRTSIFNFARPESLRRLWDHVHGEGSLRPEELDVLARYRAAMQLASGPAVGEGLTFDLCYCQSEQNGFDPDRHFAFLRHSGNETLLFCCNFSDHEARMTISVPYHAAEYFGLMTNPRPEGVSVTVAPFDYTVISL